MLRIMIYLVLQFENSLILTTPLKNTTHRYDVIADL